MTTARAPWAVTALMALGTFLSMFALSTLIEDRSWMRTVLFVLILCAGVSIGVRMVSRSRLLPTAAALLTGIVLMVAMFSVDDEGNRQYLPTPSGISGLWRAISDGAEYAATTAAPAAATPELVALLTAFAVGIFVLADHLASSWRAVAVSGIVLLLPWSPAIFLQYQVPLWALFASAGCWMVAMAVARSAVAAQRSAPVGGALIATVAALMAAMIVAPSAIGGTGWGAIPRFNAPSALDTSTRLNLALDLRNSLTVNSAQEVLTYVSSGQHPDALRLYTLRDFDGTTWTREKDDATDLVPAATGLLWPEPAPAWNDTEQVLLSFNVTALSERNLPLPPVPRSVDVDNSWSYSPSRDEVSTSGDGTRGLQYSAVAALEYFTADSLRGAQEAIVTSSSSPEAMYTAIPTSVDIGRLQALAADITSDSTTRYDEAVALQNYLRDASQFTYDTSVSPASGGDAVSEFLDTRTGYCVQFATTMVMLSRSIGIPARMAVGFLGGQLSDGDVWSVRGGDAHAWPELYFPGQGWVRFEPTPAVQTGSAPSYTIAAATGGNAPIPSNVPVPTALPTTGPQTAAPLPTTGANAGGEAGGVPSWALAVAVLVVAGIAITGWMLRRRAAALAAAHGPDSAWAELRNRLPEGWRWERSATPIEAASGLEHRMATTATPLSAEGAAALAELRDAVSDHRYAPPSEHVPTHEWLIARVDLIANEANEAIRSRSDRVGAQSALRRDP